MNLSDDFEEFKKDDWHYVKKLKERIEKLEADVKYHDSSIMGNAVDIRFGIDAYNKLKELEKKVDTLSAEARKE